MSNNLTYFERQKLQYWLRTRQSLRAIAKIMRKNHSVLVRELSRNACGERKKYRADVAQKKYESRKRSKHRGKLDKCVNLKEYVEEKLRANWSPEQIAGRLKREGGVETISHESIYHHVYTKSDKYKKLYKHLRTRRDRRQKLGGRKPTKIRIAERISIQKRPEVIGQRQRYGDWESDSMIFSQQKAALSVQVERKSQLLRLHRVANKSAEETNAAITQTAESVPKDLFKSLTMDNGSENARHAELKTEYDLETYFCDPFSSWQKGSVENMNKLIRQYLPRKTDLKTLTDRDIYEIQEKLNNRPRKKLDYRTPNEVINQVVH
jgi:IS30 family transposase